MWPILVCSVIGLAIAIERILFLSRANAGAQQLLTQVSQALQNRELAKAKQLCDQSPGPLASTVKAGIPLYGRPRDEIRETMEEQAALELPSLERYIPLLGTVAHLSPLLGLLGTVTGLVRCFQSIQEKSIAVSVVNPGDLAGGIWEALLTTVFGLLVAIPAYGMYNYLTYRVNRLANTLEVSVIHLTRCLSSQDLHAA